jgi:hypothetical protein
MSAKEETAPRLLTTVVIAEKESTVLLNWDLITTKVYPKDKRPFQDLMVESSVPDASRAESSELFYSNKWKPSKKPEEFQENEHYSASSDYLNFYFANFHLISTIKPF